MHVPLSIVGPAAVAGLAYFNAKTGFSYDGKLLIVFAKATIKQQRRLNKDRLNLFYKLEEYAHDPKVANNVFIIFEGREWTYKATYERVMRYGTWLKSNYGVKSKEIVAMVCGNSDTFIFLWFGLWSIGAKPAFINYNLTGKSLVHCLRTSTARVVVIDREFEAATDEIKNDLPQMDIVPLSSQNEAAMIQTVPVRQPDKDRTEDKFANMAALIYTSGTTGLPKAAILSWTKVAVAGPIFAEWMGMQKSDVLYTSMPLYHTSASCLGVGTVMSCGATLSIGKKFSTKVFWEDVRSSNATIIQYVGETCRYLLSAPPQFDPVTGENLDKKNSVRIAFGNGLRPDVWNKFKERFDIETIAEFYSATEGSGATFNLSRNDFSKGAIGRNGLFGRLMSKGNRVLVELDWETEEPWRDPKSGYCRQVSMGEPGELLYKLDATDIGKGFQGYFRNDKASESKIMRNVLVKGDAYFRTGDMIRWDGERTFFSDRIGDTYRWKGENVSTNEVSEVLGTHPAVQEANVYGVELPNHDGRAGCVAIILTREATADTMKSVAEHARKQLPRFAVPLFLRVTKGMAMTGTNKQQKHVIRAQGVEPAKVGEDELFWLKDGTYARFEEKDWKKLHAGQVKL